MVKRSRSKMATSPTTDRNRHGKNGTKYKLLNEGDVQVCRLNHTRTIVSKIMNSKYLRRWETHRLILNETCIKSSSTTGFMEQTVPYSIVEDINIVSRWDAGQKFCMRVTIPDGSLLIQIYVHIASFTVDLTLPRGVALTCEEGEKLMQQGQWFICRVNATILRCIVPACPNYEAAKKLNNAYVRDQWYHSLQWKRQMYRFEKMLKNCQRPEILVKEIKCMVDLSLSTPLSDANVYQFPLDLVSELLQQNEEFMTSACRENVILALGPLLEHNQPTQEICDFFTKHCKNSPRSRVVIDLFTPVVHRILKHNMDFGKFPRMRSFVQEYIQALNLQNDGKAVVEKFIRSMHGFSSTCPHPRVLPNLVAVCLAAIYNCYEDKRILQRLNNNLQVSETEYQERLLCYLKIMEVMATYEDWRPGLGMLIQPIPFPDDALADSLFTMNLKPTLNCLAEDHRCDVHQTLLCIREGKEGWFRLYCPGGIACDDEGELFGIMLDTLINCCCRRKKFLMSMSKMISSCMLLALRGKDSAMEALCAMLEFELIESNDLKMQMITTLQSTASGKRMYTALCDRQIALQELQQKGGPKKLTLPTRSTDSDLAKLLSSGSFGNVECLSLAFTQVTSGCAKELIKLPSLRYLNLWCTQFGDPGVQLISEHLPKLQVLNLCETPVTDKGLQCLASLKNLRKLNLNSTSLSALTFEDLKEKLPALQEVDIRYTDAW